MTTPDLYAMRSEDDELDLGIVYAASEHTLRLFSASYMQDKSTSGTLKILNPQGVTISTFDVWQNTWVEAADEGK